MRLSACESCCCSEKACGRSLTASQSSSANPAAWALQRLEYSQLLPPHWTGRYSKVQATPAAISGHSKLTSSQSSSANPAASAMQRLEYSQLLSPHWTGRYSIVQILALLSVGHSVRLSACESCCCSEKACGRSLTASQSSSANPAAWALQRLEYSQLLPPHWTGRYSKVQATPAAISGHSKLTSSQSSSANPAASAMQRLEYSQLLSPHWTGRYSIVQILALL